MIFDLRPGPVKVRWRGATVIVAAPGPSLTKDVAELCRGHRVVAVQDAYKRLPFADVMYGCDAKWWDHHNGAMDFEGERWSSHGEKDERGVWNNDKRQQFLKYKIKMVRGKRGDIFSTDPEFIYYGSNSGFQAVNLTGLFMGWEGTILLAGFDMREVHGKRHFFGDHPEGFSKTSNYQMFIDAFESASKRLPLGIRIYNTTPGSALTCFPKMDLAEALQQKVAA